MDDRVKVASLTGWAAATVEGRVSRRIAAALIGASFERLTEAECLRTANAVTGDILSELRASDTGRSEAEASKPGVVLRDLSFDEARARYQAWIDARWRQRVAEAYTLNPPAGQGETRS